MSSECIVSSPPGSEMMYLMMIYQIADRWFAKQNNVLSIHNKRLKGKNMKKMYHFTNMKRITAGTVLVPGSRNQFGAGVYFSTNMCAEYAHISNGNAVCIVMDADSSFLNVPGRPYTHSNGQSIRIDSLTIRRVDLRDPRSKGNAIYSTLRSKGAINSIALRPRVS